MMPEKWKDQSYESVASKMNPENQMKLGYLKIVNQISSVATKGLLVAKCSSICHLFSVIVTTSPKYK